MSIVLPPEAASALESFLAERDLQETGAAYHRRNALLQQLAAGLGLAVSRGILAPDALTPAQRFVAERLSERECNVHPLPFPADLRTRRRWLGLDPGGYLEQSYEGRPRWKAIEEPYLAQDYAAAADPIVALPPPERLRAIAELSDLRYGIDPSWILLERLDLLQEIGPSGHEWLPRWIEQKEHFPYLATVTRLAFFLALARAGVVLEPRWDATFPIIATDPYLALTKECLLAYPTPRQSVVLLAALSGWGSSDKSFVECAVALLPHFPFVDVARAALERAPKVHALTRKELTAVLKSLAHAHPEIAALGKKSRSATPKPVLSVSAVRSPASLHELSAIEQAQLQIACTKWDGEERSAAARFADPAIAGTLELRSIAGPDGPAYDALLFAGDSGSVFRAGTTEEVGGVVQNHLEVEGDALRAALEVALSARPKKRAKKAARPAKKR